MIFDQFSSFSDYSSSAPPSPQPAEGPRCAGPVVRAGPRRRLGTSPTRPGGPGMRRIHGRSDLEKSKIFKNLGFSMIFGSWARPGLGIRPPGASEAQRHCGPAAEPGESAGGPRDPGSSPTLPVVSRVARGSFAAVQGPPGRPQSRGELRCHYFKKSRILISLRPPAWGSETCI